MGAAIWNLIFLAANLLMNFNVVREVRPVCPVLEKEHGKLFRLPITTNGLLLVMIRPI
jgi:hypothetical protein